MKTIKLKVYKFKELSKQAQQKAIENNYNINTDYDWFTYVYDDHRERMSEIGINVTEIYFSGFSSQGDGAMFECNIDIEKLLPELSKSNNYDRRVIKLIQDENICLSGGIKHMGHCYHENCHSSSLDFEFMQDYNSELERVNEVLTEMYDDIIELYKDKCRELYKMLERDYDNLTSEEVIQESLEANEYDFLSNGDRY